VKQRGYLYGGWTTTLNIALNAVTGFNYLWLEGRITNGVVHNWIHRFRYRPKRYDLPRTEQEIVDLVRTSARVRVLGSGHSFNGGIRSAGTLVSLDRYTGILHEDTAAKELTVRAGTRVRDVNKLLLERGWAFPALPSHNAQSIGGILATDVHGTGRTFGWISEFVPRIKVIDGRGNVHLCTPDDDLYHAAVGGIGAVGIITEVTVRARERFNVEQRTVMDDLDSVASRLNQLLADNEHLSLYLFPFTRRCQVNTWNEIAEPASKFGRWREFLHHSTDALTSAWLGGLLAVTGRLRKSSPTIYKGARQTRLVLESAEAYSRSIYHTHQELEFAVPYEDFQRVAELMLRTFQNLSDANPRGLPFTIIEARFTPAGHTRTLLGPGRDRRTAWIDLVCNDTRGFETYYAAAELLLRDLGARPHLGKYIHQLDHQDLAKVHGAHFTRFQSLRTVHDPQHKFHNSFTSHILGD
jgi:FAD/FMN-containing dehydrogenase